MPLRERGVEVRMEFGGTEIAVSCYKQHDGDKLLDAKVRTADLTLSHCAVCITDQRLVCRHQTRLSCEGEAGRSTTAGCPNIAHVGQIVS